MNYRKAQNKHSISGCTFFLYSDIIAEKRIGNELLVKGFKEGNQCQTLLGVIGSGKTFTMTNVIQQLNKPTLIIVHNKTLDAQLYSEFRVFFPNDAVEYFVS